MEGEKKLCTKKGENGEGYTRQRGNEYKRRESGRGGGRNVRKWK